MNWLDWVIIIILVLSALRGLRSGLLKSLSGLAGMIIGLVVAFTYHRAFAAYLSTRWNMQEKLQPMLENFLKNWLPANETLTHVQFPGKTIAALPAASNPLNPLGDYLTGVFASGILEVLCFLVLLFATVWAASLAGSILTKIADVSFLGLPNHLGGLLFGLVRGIIVVLIVLTLMSPFQRGYAVPGSESGSPGTSLPPGKAFQDSILLPYFDPIFDAIKYPLPDRSERVQDGLWQIPVTEASKT
ncbi:MAG: CvpA family protein [Pelotomaculaceae bacterium]|nr:CvpA family protein [Bacillota bacterium]HHU86738.1 CvpA family protein [Peptococcaceae bacterium]